MNDLYPVNKALLLIANNYLFNVAKKGLTACSLKAEEIFYNVQQCRFVILDRFYLQAGIPNYFEELNIRKPLYLLLTESETATVQDQRQFQDIVTVMDQTWGHKKIISREGKRRFPDIFEDYMPRFVSHPERIRIPNYQPAL